MPSRSSRTVSLVILSVIAWGTAIYLLQLQTRIGPARQVINVRWAPDTSDAARRAAEAMLMLQGGEARDPRTWAYHLQDHSREAIRRIVTHPLVEDTSHVDRRAYTVLIDAPEVPRIVRRVLETDLAPATSVALALFGVALLWAARRELRLLAVFVSSFRGAGLAAAVLCLCVGFAFFYDNGQAVDENNHYDQIVRLASGNWSMNPTLTMLPGFHALVAALVSVTGGVSEFSVRVTVFALSLATVGVFYALATRIEPPCAGMRTLQFTLLPILFPQFFLIYTDVTSVLFVLSMMLAAADRRYWLAGGLGLVACLVRQDNVIWLAFVVLWSYLRDHGWSWTPIAQTLTRYSTFVATGVVFLLLVAANHGQVALGEDAGSHPLRSLHLTNIFFLMFLSCVLFLPLWWGYRREFLERLRSRWLWLALLGLLPVFWLGFVNDHPHNTERADYFLRNAILIYFSSTAVRKLLFFIPVAIAGIGFAAVPMKRAWWLIYPFTILFLLPEWLVEQRYYLIPLTLFLLGRESSSPRSERLQTMLFVAGSAALFMMVERSWGWM